MRSLFIEAKYTGKIDLDKIPVKKLPKNIGLAASVQFVDTLDEIKQYLEKNDVKVHLSKGKQKYPGQVLGCEQSAVLSVDKRSDAFLYIGDGRFHPLGIALKTGKDVYSYNPLTKLFSVIKKEETEKIKKQKKGSLIKFYSADHVGLLVSTKPGQENLKAALKIKKKYPEKEFYIFLFDTLNPNDMENFPFVQAWVNTACPRISDEKKIVNYDELL